MYLVYWALSRLQEPSTYAGLASLLLLVGVQLDNSQLQAVTQVLMALAGAAAVFLPEANPDRD